MFPFAPSLCICNLDGITFRCETDIRDSGIAVSLYGIVIFSEMYNLL